ncbi:MAG: beta-ketoacyl synthase chain length factor [Bacteroidales bacterium]|nr:beta-ketoacyl synthase chain length factor [Bacteroidales bacterium]
MKTKLYINGIGAVSRLKDFNELQSETQQPTYKELIPAMKLRRMSRIMRMSNFAAITALKQAEIDVPQAINVGTAYGCLVDTEKFLSTLLDNNEEFSNPSAFINSTHNTLAGSLAILLGAKGQNFTFVHAENAFENALIDASISLEEGSYSDILVGGADEKTEILESISANFMDEEIGEGAAFLSLSKKQQPNCKAVIKGVSVDNKAMDTSDFVNAFCHEMEIDAKDISLVLSNKNLIASKPFIDYKSMIGDYPSITAFASTLAVNIIEKQRVPDFLEWDVFDINNVLVYNSYKNGSQSLILISNIFE